MKLYSDIRSGSCRRVLALISHLELEVEIVPIDILAGETHTAEFLSINPNGMLPVLMDGDMTLWEASAIMIHLCETKGDTTFWPTGPARLNVLRWMFWAAEHFRQPAPIYFEENVVAPLMGSPPDQSRLDGARRQLERFTPILEEHLRDRAFVCGDAPTLADIDLAVVTSQMPRSGVPYQNYPHVIAWLSRLEAAIPAWASTGARLNTAMNAALHSLA